MSLKNKILISILIIFSLIIFSSILIFLISGELENKETISQVNQYILEGDNYLLAGEYEKAKESYSKALKLAPNDPLIYHRLGNVSLQLGDYELAKKYFNKALNLKPTPLLESKSYLGLGKAYFNNLQYRKAMDYIQKSLAVDLPLRIKEEIIESDAYPLLGRSFYMLGDFKASEEYFKKVLNLELQDPSRKLLLEKEAYDGLGLLHSTLGDHQEALEYSNKSIALDKDISLIIPSYPSRFLPYLIKARVYQSRREREKAVETLEKALQLVNLYPHYPLYDFFKAQIYNKLGKNALALENFVVAENYFKEVLKIKKEGYFPTKGYATEVMVEVYDGLGEVALNFRNYTEAQTYFENGLNEISTIGDFDSFHEKLSFGIMEILFHYRKAFTYYKMGNLLEAKNEIKKSIELTELLSPEIYSIMEKIPLFKDGESIFQKIYFLEKELESY